MSNPTLQQCLEFAELVGLRVITRQDRRRSGEYFDVYLVYRLGVKEGKSRSTRGLMKLLEKIPAAKTLEPQQAPPPAAPAAPRRDLGTRRKQWWEED